MSYFIISIIFFYDFVKKGVCNYLEKTLEFLSLKKRQVMAEMSRGKHVCYVRPAEIISSSIRNILLFEKDS